MLKTVLYKLFRFKPVIAWAFCGILLGLSVAINEYGFGLNWVYIYIAILPIVILQAFIAHAVNDISDEEVDKITDLKATNRYKVLVSGIISRDNLILLSSFFIALTTATSVILYTKFGIPILVFYAVGLYAALCYSLPPLKLGWRPYSEWTIVLPVLVTLVVAVNYIATGFFSYLAVTIGILFALYNIIWFLVSRMMDYEPDKIAGKITTFVKLGIDHKYRIHPYLACVFIVLALFIFYIGFFINASIGIISSTICIFLIYYLPEHCDKSPQVLSICRKYLIYISIINSIVVSFILIYTH